MQTKITEIMWVDLVVIIIRPRKAHCQISLDGHFHFVNKYRWDFSHVSWLRVKVCMGSGYYLNLNGHECELKITNKSMTFFSKKKKSFEKIIFVLNKNKITKKKEWKERKVNLFFNSSSFRFFLILTICSNK